MNKKSLLLNSLNLKNFATFSDQTIQFKPGFNSIIGETGSGKSLILDALNFIFGQRADKKIIRKDSDYSVIEASFSVNDKSIKDFFFELGLPFDDEVVIKRVIYKNGKSKSFVNFQQCSLNTLSELSRRYIDLVGQFENQKLFSEKYQLILLDSFINCQDLLNTYQIGYQNYLDLKQELLTLKEKQREVLQHKDYIEFQLKELEELSPSVEDENDLISKKDLFSNTEANSQDLEHLNALFEGDTEAMGIVDLLNRAKKLINSNNSISDSIKTDAIDTFEKVQEINYAINKELSFDEVEFEIDDVIDRLDKYKKLQRKYDTNTEGLILKLSELRKEHTNLDNIDKMINVVESKIDGLTSDLYEQATILHKKRITGSAKLSTELTNQVRKLNMSGATLSLSIVKSEKLNEYGLTHVSFMAETNPGEGFYKVKDIASGGELSRILLSLKQTISAKDSVSIFLFDEIDTGMGGETAFKIGETLKSVSRGSQVIAITHLPQIAQFSDILIKVEKSITDNRTISEVHFIENDKIKEEISAMTPLI